MAYESDSQVLSQPFMELPPAQYYPDYYKLIKYPIDLGTIQKKIKLESYSTIDSFMADIKLIFNNATTYNQEGSSIFQDARTLLNLAKSEASRRQWVDFSLKNPSKSTDASDSGNRSVDDVPTDVKVWRYNIMRTLSGNPFLGKNSIHS